MSMTGAPPTTPAAAALAMAGLRAGALNAHCLCRFRDDGALRLELEREPALAGLLAEIDASRPHLFSPTMVFASRAELQAMTATVAAIESVVAHPAWQALALAQAPDSAHAAHGPAGVFMGYDFHLGEDGPKLIEINTNAGGAWLAAALTRAQRACCAESAPLLATPTDVGTLDATWRAMFRAEWQAQVGEAPLAHLVIVDDAPATQFLYPEFRLARQRLAEPGVRVSIADPAALVWRDGALWLGEARVDLVYNRLTDFYLDEPGHAALRAAYLAGAVVLTPHPRAHALYADKRHLVRLADPALHDSLGLDAATRATLAAHVPCARPVTPDTAEQLWQDRRRFFFKPATGFGSRATYRGDKLTRRVWGEILAGHYIAQCIAPPGARRVQRGSDDEMLKFDVRAYAYRGAIQCFAARLYAGQTTNFRTPGGGFAPVIVTPE